MTDYKKLIEALRECARADADCRNNCPYYNHDACTDDLKSDAAAAIEDLQAEVDALKETLKAVQKNSGINFRMWEEAQAEVEQLKAELIDCV